MSVLEAEPLLTLEVEKALDNQAAEAALLSILEHYALGSISLLHLNECDPALANLIRQLHEKLADEPNWITENRDLFGLESRLLSLSRPNMPPSISVTGIILPDGMRLNCDAIFGHTALLDLVKQSEVFAAWHAAAVEVASRQIIREQLKLVQKNRTRE
jgi:hypothetical protein